MGDPAEEIDQWLVRTSRNEILGPFPKEEIIEQIQQGLLGPDDEVCHANHYWIYLDEREEVAQQLGIEAPGRYIEGDEPTQTQSDLRTKEITIRPSSGQPMSMSGNDDSHLPDIPEMGGDLSENTAVLNNRALRQFQSRGNLPPPPPGAPVSHHRGLLSPTQGPFVLGKVEQPSVLRFVVTGLVILIICLVGLVIYVLKAAH
jgi:hypothetical protein